MPKRNTHTPDPSEFVRLLTQHQAMIRGYIRTLIPNTSDVTDVLQNTNIALWERRDKFEIGTNFKAWAFTVARYRCLEHRKKLQRDGCMVFSANLADLLAEDIAAKTSLEPDEKQVALEYCLGSLKQQDRQLIAARYSNRMTLDEYSKHDGRSPGSLRVILNRLRIKLRDCIERRLAGEGGLQ